MTARYLIGDTRQRLTELADHSVDLILTSPPFLALRSYLPDGHPDKAKEIGSEATPAAYLDVLLELTADWGRVLAPHGSIAVELGDTYAGSGGAGGDYGEDGLREGQPAFGGSGRLARYDDERGNPDGMRDTTFSGANTRNGGGSGWPLPKSLACIPQLYQVALAYGINPLTGRESPAGRWRVRNLKPWIRSNPPVGALGDKERPATSYVIVACRASDRWFDLDAVRTHSDYDRPNLRGNGSRGPGHDVPGQKHNSSDHTVNAGGAPPRDWWHHVDAVLDAELAARAGKLTGWSTGNSRTGKATDDDHRGGNWSTLKGNSVEDKNLQTGAQGVHLRRALERAGILTTLEALDVSPKGYSGAHYAVWPPELVRLLVDEMCPRRVCTTCGEPSRRITEADYVQTQATSNSSARGLTPDVHAPGADPSFTHGRANRVVTTLGWSDCGCECCTCNGHDHRGSAGRCAFCDCGHDTWRPGHVLDPFAGSGTTLAVATGMGRTATGIDIDERNADLARDRVGMFLEVDHPTREIPA